MPDNTNAAPDFTSKDRFEVGENETAVGTVIATDADTRDYITSYAISGGDDHALFSITRLGALTFDGNGADFDRPVDVGRDNSYLLTVEATSGTGDRVRTATQTITVEVVNVVEPPGRPPAPLLATRLEEERYIVEVRPGGAPANTGPDIGGYEIQYRAMESSSLFANSILLISDEVDWETDIPGLINGTTYEVRIQALSGEGLSEWSPISEITIPNEAPVVDGTIDAVTGTVGGAVEIAYALSVFSDPDGPDSYLQYTATSSDETVATVEMIGFAVRITPVAAGTATITVTARDPHGGTAAATFDATIQATTLLAPTLSISGDDFTIGFTDDFAASETRAYEVRIRHKTPVGPWAGACIHATNTADFSRNIAASLDILASGFFEPGATYEADYGYLGADCGGSLTGSRSATGEVTTSGAASFDIELVFVGSISSTNRSHIEDAAERWEEIITGDLPNHQLTSRNREYLNRRYPGTTAPEVVDDIVIYVRTGYVLGLAAATSLSHRTPSSLPFASEIVLGTSNVINYLVALHEIGHALGFGTYPWTAHDLLKDPSRGIPFGSFIDPSPDTHFSGEKAIAAFDAAGGTSYTGAKVPVENSSLNAGSRDSHWRQSVMRSELMTPGSSDPAPLSAITIQAIADLGYTVDVTQADAYTLPSTSKIAIGSEGLIPLSCVIEHPEAGPDEPEPIILNLRRVGERE